MEVCDPVYDVCILVYAHISMYVSVKVVKQFRPDTLNGYHHMAMGNITVAFEVLVTIPLFF